MQPFLFIPSVALTKQFTRNFIIRLWVDLRNMDISSRPSSITSRDFIVSSVAPSTMDIEGVSKGTSELEGSPQDRNDMNRMGKLQEFKRNFRPLAALSFSAVLQATWEFILM